MTLVRRNTIWDEWPELMRFPESLGSFAPDRVNIEEYTDGDTFVVRAELPGLDPEKDVKITVSEGMLTILAERKEESSTRERSSYRSEFRYGMCSRTLPLPAGVTEDDVKATSANGIIEVRMPIDKKKATARQIPVTALS